MQEVAVPSSERITIGYNKRAGSCCRPFPMNESDIPDGGSQIITKD